LAGQSRGQGRRSEPEKRTNPENSSETNLKISGTVMVNFQTSDAHNERKKEEGKESTVLNQEQGEKRAIRPLTLLRCGRF